MNYHRLMCQAKEYLTSSKYRIVNTEDAADFLRPLLQKQPSETCIVLYLNTNNDVLEVEQVALGTVEMCCIAPREVFRAAINHNATSIIIAHNHPSGEYIPSKEDIDISKKIVKAGKIMAINVLDVVIFGNKSKEEDKDYYSFAEHQRLKKGILK